MMDAVNFNLDIGFNKKSPLVKDIKASASVSEVCMLVGPNGVGKSTLLRTISGQQKLIRGDCNILGKSINSFSSKEKSELISFVSTEKIRPSNMSVFSYVSMGRYIYTNWLGQISEDDEAVILKSLEITDTSHLLNRMLSEISDGELQKVMIARAICQNTPVILLDEPTSFLDISSKYEIVLLLKKIARTENKCVILSTHDINIVIELADKIWMLHDNKIVEGAPEDLILNKSIESLFTSSKLKLKINSGNVELINPDINKQCFLKCDNSEQYVWYTKALNKLGYKIVSDSDIVPKIQVSKNIIKWFYKAEYMEFQSIYQLNKYLRE